MIKKFFVLIFAFALVMNSGYFRAQSRIPVLLQAKAAAHVHTDACYIGTKHYHTDPCKKKNKSQLQRPNANCVTCGGDGMLSSSCGGTIVSRIIAEDTDEYSAHYQDAYEVWCGADIMECKCNKCSYVIYVGPFTEVVSEANYNGMTQSEKNRVIPFYRAIGELGFWGSGQIFHSINRCPDCMGEIMICAHCGGNCSRYFGSGANISCRGRILRKHTTFTLQHSAYVTFPEGYNPGPGYVAPTHYGASISFDYDICDTCDEIVWRENIEVNLRCSSCQGSHNFYPYSNVQTATPRQGQTCGLRYAKCRNCHQGAEIYYPICGQKEGVYYDASGNILSESCNKVVVKIETKIEE